MTQSIKLENDLDKKAKYRVFVNNDPKGFAYYSV